MGDYQTLGFKESLVYTAPKDLFWFGAITRAAFGAAFLLRYDELSLTFWACLPLCHRLCFLHESGMSLMLCAKPSLTILQALCQSSRNALVHCLRAA
jgi:hypothetical protein